MPGGGKAPERSVLDRLIDFHQNIYDSIFGKGESGDKEKTPPNQTHETESKESNTKVPDSDSTFWGAP